MTGRRAARAALLVALLTGCSSQAPDNDAKASASPSAAAADTSAAHRGDSIGAEGSACELPVTFDIAAEWKAEAVTGSLEGDSEVSQDIADAVLRQGPVVLVCEVDAKPAGNIGFLRAWTGEPGDDDARTVLEAFVAAQGGVSKERGTPPSPRAASPARR